MEELRSLYNKYKSILYPVLFVVGGIVIIFQVILPTLTSIGDLRAQVSSQEQLLSDYQGSMSVLKNITLEDFTPKVDTTVAALPSSKDLQAFYLAITKSSTASNVSLNGFSARLGDVFQKNGQKQQAVLGIPFVVVSVKLSGVDVESMSLFLKDLTRELPLSQVVRLSFAQGTADADIQFFYKPFDLSYLNKIVVAPLSSQDQKILNQLSSF